MIKLPDGKTSYKNHCIEMFHIEELCIEKFYL